MEQQWRKTNEVKKELVYTLSNEDMRLAALKVSQDACIKDFLRECIKQNLAHSEN